MNIAQAKAAGESNSSSVAAVHVEVGRLGHLVLPFFVLLLVRGTIMN